MNEEKKQIKRISQLINDEEFLRSLCAFFNNNEENVDKILSLIIIYYLDTLDQNFDYTIEELVKNVNRKYSPEGRFTSNSNSRTRLCYKPELYKQSFRLPFLHQAL